MNKQFEDTETQHVHDLLVQSLSTEMPKLSANFELRVNLGIGHQVQAFQILRRRFFIGYIIAAFVTSSVVMTSQEINLYLVLIINAVTMGILAVFSGIVRLK